MKIKNKKMNLNKILSKYNNFHLALLILVMLVVLDLVLKEIHLLKMIKFRNLK